MPAAVRRTILDRDVSCRYCGDPADEVDHVVPCAQGGTAATVNLVAACGDCNLDKGERTPEEWRQDRLARGEHWPPRGQLHGTLAVLVELADHPRNSMTVEEFLRATLAQQERLAQGRAERMPRG